MAGPPIADDSSTPAAAVADPGDVDVAARVPDPEESDGLDAGENIDRALEHLPARARYQLEAIREDLEEVTDDATRQRLQRRWVEAVKSIEWDGDFPPIELFAGYPDAVRDRLLDSWLVTRDVNSEAARASIRIAEGISDANIDLANRGQKLGFALALAALIAAVVLGLAGQPWLGAVVFGAGLATLVAIVVKARVSDE
jgi:hypothetical protein